MWWGVTPGRICQTKFKIVSLSDARVVSLLQFADACVMCPMLRNAHGGPSSWNVDLTIWKAVSSSSRDSHCKVRAGQMHISVSTSCRSFLASYPIGSGHGGRVVSPAHVAMAVPNLHRPQSSSPGQCVGET